MGIAGDTAVIGAPGHHHACPEPDCYGCCQNLGAVYVFQFDSSVWNEDHEIFFSADPWAGQNLGRSVAVDGDTALIGATYGLGNGNTSGSALVINLNSVAGDLDCNRAVDVADLLILLAAWGACVGCPADLNTDGTVNITDLLTLLSNWSG